MEPSYLEHHKLLVYAMYLLSQASISPEDLALAENLLDRYVVGFQLKYGEDKMLPNVHNLLHLATNVKDFGTTDGTSCFAFEDLNGQLTSLIHGTRHVGLQVMNAASLFIGFENFKTKFLVEGSGAYNFCQKIKKVNQRKKISFISESVSAIGAFKKEKLTDDIKNLLT